MFAIMFAVSLFMGISTAPPTSTDDDGHLVNVPPKIGKIVNDAKNYIANLHSFGDPMVTNLGLVDFRQCSSNVGGVFAEIIAINDKVVAETPTAAKVPKRSKLQLKTEKTKLCVTYGGRSFSFLLDFWSQMSVELVERVVYGSRTTIAQGSVDLRIADFEANMTLTSEVDSNTQLKLRVDSLSDEIGHLKVVYEIELGGQPLNNGELRNLFGAIFP